MQFADMRLILIRWVTLYILYIDAEYKETHSLYVIDIQKECFAFIQLIFHCFK